MWRRRGVHAVGLSRSIAAPLKPIATAPLTIPHVECAARRGTLLASQRRSSTGAAFEYFGRTRVPRGEKQRMVSGVFDSVASRYDFMNDMLSGGLHRRWKDYFVFDVLRPAPNMSVLDVAGGTGDVAFRIVESMMAQSSESKRSGDLPAVVVCDINAAMLRVGIRRALDRGMRCEYISEDLRDATTDQSSDMPLAVSVGWCVGNAEALPFKESAFDAYTISFGIRNVPDMSKAVREAYRVLNVGGRFLCMEFSPLDDVLPGLRDMYNVYLDYGVPTAGAVLVGDRDSYQYLSESIVQFPKAIAFRQIMQTAGFRACTSTPVMGGIVHIHSGFKL